MVTPVLRILARLNAYRPTPPDCRASPPRGVTRRARRSSARLRHQQRHKMTSLRQRDSAPENCGLDDPGFASQRPVVAQQNRTARPPPRGTCLRCVISKARDWTSRGLRCGRQTSSATRPVPSGQPGAGVATPLRAVCHWREVSTRDLPALHASRRRLGHLRRSASPTTPSRRAGV